MKNFIPTSRFLLLIAVFLVIPCTGCDNLLQIVLGSPLTGSLEVGLSPTGVDVGLNAPLGMGSVDVETGLDGTSVTCTGPDGALIPCNGSDS
ncbi:MAG: hypothetical protein JSV03_14125 [Planctomycetota bacterium]|nr:MAG: hypothetical protein JSV03_14125 [Planctomycetota bacterium]